MLRTLLLTFLAVSAFAATYTPTGFHETRLATGLNPTTLAALPDGRVLVCEKQGLLRLVENGSLVAAPLLDLANEIDTFNERGLDGIVIDPDFATNGHVFLFYTARHPVPHNRVSRFTLAGGAIDPLSEAVLIDLSPLGTAGHHNGGGMAIGNDGYLYVACGENGTGDHAQSLANTHGKILRLARDPLSPIPTDNPFYAQTTGPARAIASLGLRNPFTLAKDPVTGDLLICDVGGALYEEVNRYELGVNYGWPGIEGNRTTQTPPANYRDPLYAYDHAAGICVLGGVFYRPTAPVAGTAFPAAYTGKFFFADIMTPNWMKTFDAADPYGTVAPFASGHKRIVSTAVAPDGALWYLQLGGFFDGNSQSKDGSLWRVAYTGSEVPTIGGHPLSVTGAVGTRPNLEVFGNGTGPLTYQWTLNGSPISGATKSTYLVPALTLAMSGNAYACTVANAFGSATSNPAIVTVTTNTAPTNVKIVKPTTGTTYSGGLLLNLEGSASDNQGTLPDTAYTWNIELYHANHDIAGSYHVHPFAGPINGRLASVTVPLQGENDPEQFIRITLSVTDDGGLTSSYARDYLPARSTLTLATVPAGGQVLLDGATVTTPAAIVGIVGYQRTIAALPPINYGFSAWSDGGAASHVISPGTSGLTLTATYAPLVQAKLAFTAASYTVTEGTPTLTVKVERTQSSVGAVSVHVKTQAVTAQLGSDLGTVDTVLTWADGVLGQQSVAIPIINDSTEELKETAKVVLAEATGFPELGTSPVITINDDDASLVQFATGRLTVAEGSPVTIAVNRIGGGAGDISVTVAGSRHTGTAGASTSDLPNLATTVLTWAAGDMTPRSVTLTSLTDALAEGNETYGLRFSASTGLVRLGTTTTVTIIDDEVVTSTDPLAVDVGATLATGRAWDEAGVLVVQGGGTGIASKADSLTLATVPLTGDGTVEARLDSFAAANAGGRVALTLRQDQAINAPLVALTVGADGSVALMQRTATTANATTLATATGLVPPCWLRLERHGGHIHAETSPDGVVWTMIGTASWTAPATLLAGPAVWSKDNLRLGVARFRDLDVAPGSSN